MRPRVLYCAVLAFVLAMVCGTISAPARAQVASGDEAPNRLGGPLPVPTASSVDLGLRLKLPDRPFFKDSRYRYDQADLLSRVGMDLLGMPLNVGYWDARDWTFAALLASATATLMLPSGGSPDARLQRVFGGGGGSAGSVAFPHITTIHLGVGAAAFVSAAGLVGWLDGDPEVAEYASLTAEALLVTHVFHISSKLAMGREAPEHGRGEGTVHGPSRGDDYFPSGTPSGHAATVCSMAAVAAEYYRTPAARAIGYAACGYMSASLIYNDQHFVSDVLWGGAMGYVIGRWVVQHRSTRYAGLDEAAQERHDFFILPFGDGGNNGLGLSFVMAFR